RVFNDKKVTDHHAIIPTGVESKLEARFQAVYDIITRRFIAVFYEDCEVDNTSVIGKAADVSFKTSGKEITKKGWRVVFENDTKKKDKEDNILPSFVKGEKGPHEPSFLKKETKPPKMFTEASLLRAMETAGKQVDDEEMRDLMKENGIGRPSTRANIIETLFRRKYIKRNKKQIIPTETGIQLIKTIKNDLLKSAELTGRWEKQLRDIEKGSFNAGAFINNMKKMVDQLVYEVRIEKKSARITHLNNNKTTPKKTPNPASHKCPKCGKGAVLKGSSAFGCSAFKEGCDFRIPFKFLDKKIPEKQIERLLTKGTSTKLKGFKKDGNKADGYLSFDEDQQLILSETPKNQKETKKTAKESLQCPKCNKGFIQKGKTAFGCDNFKNGCNFVVSFEEIKAKAKDREITKTLVHEIILSIKT
ncbi:MAG: DNA topoisomerase, partial [Flavobacteriales bacterium]|nr:DNA topoisomerase [Flavobacteriales bacterium]